MSELYVAVHKIDGQEPGTFITPKADDLQFLKDAGAIREPTDAELRVHEQIKGVNLAEEPVANGHPEIAEAEKSPAIETAAVVAEPDSTKPDITGDDLDVKTNGELKALAKAEDIDLGKANNKAEYLAAIRAGRQAKATNAPSETSEGEGASGDTAGNDDLLS